MKIPILHQIEKCIRKRRTRPLIRTTSSNYVSNFKRFLKEKNYLKSKRGYFEPLPSNLSSPLQVSIIIPCFNKFEYTRNCINSIARNTETDISYEIIVIDDKSSDKTSKIENFYTNIKVIRNNENKGFLRNVNHGARLAQGEFLLLLNNDTIVLKEWLASMLEVFDNFKNIGAVGSKLIFPNGMLQEAGGYITQDQHFGNYGKFNSIFDQRYNYIREVDYVSGACLLIKRDLWNELDGFDESYLPAYFEDTDLCMRIRKKGYRVMYTPLSNIIHFESISYKSNKSTNKEHQLSKNKSIFINRWLEEIDKTHLPLKQGKAFNYERLNNCPTILYIDEEPPNDYACGSKLSKLYVELLVEMGYIVKYLPMNINPYNEKYIMGLSIKGIECCAFETKKGNYASIKAENSTGFESWMKSRAHCFDYYLLSRPRSKKYIEVIKKYDPGARFFYHPADLHFLRNQRKSDICNSEYSLSQKVLDKAQTKTKEKELYMLRNAEAVLHVSTYENRYLNNNYSINNGIIIPCLFFEKDNNLLKHSNPKELMFVGSQHEASTDAINWFIKEIFPLITKHYPETIINIIGKCGQKIIPSQNIKVHNCVSDTELEKYYKSCISVIPLRYGAGVKGKVLEAMHYHTPFVSTRIGLEGIQGIEDAKKAANTPVEFANEICCLLKNPRHQDTEVEHCHKIIQQHYTKEAAKKSLESIFIRKNHRQE